MVYHPQYKNSIERVFVEFYDMKKLATLAVLAGLPASGKSTMRQHILEMDQGQTPWYVHSTDDLIEKHATNLGLTYNSCFGQYIGQAAAQANINLQEANTRNENVLIDQTMLTAKSRRITSRFSSRKYRKTCLCILPPYTNNMENEWRRRLAARHDKIIPETVLEDMRDRFQLPTLEEDFSIIRYFDIYSNPVEYDEATILYPS